VNLMKAIITVFILIVFAITSVDLAFSLDDQELEKMAVDEDLEQEMKWLKAETFVITASRVLEDIKKAPASITVITDKQIRQMGAKHLADVLRAVPGFGQIHYYLGQRNFWVRGLGGTDSNGILIMINSHSIHEVQTGGATWTHDHLILDNVSRIEFIRGPGSALYGANAFYGVINIITKDAEAIDGFELTARGGSWDTQQYNLLFGKTFSDLEVAFNFNYFKTHGHRAFVEEDLQTFLDGIWTPFGFAPASLAPGRTNGDDETYDVALNLKYKGFTFDGRYIDRERYFPFSWVPALNEGSISAPADYYINFSYETSILETLELFVKVYRNRIKLDTDMQVHPPGFVGLTPTGPAIWQEGLLFKASAKMSRTGIELQTTYGLNDANTIVAGVTYEEQKTYDFSNAGNYLPVPGTTLLIQFPSVQKWPDALTDETNKRNFKAVFFEDIWDITNDIRLTAGVRYDLYSDFGSEVSPSVGLTWEFIQGYDVKILYGHGFRAPSFFEIASEDPAFELGPEKIDTYQASLGANFTSSFSGRVTLFHREAEDLIWPTLFDAPWNFRNLGKARDQGFEVEAKYDFGKGTYISGCYEYFSVKSGPGNSYYNAYLMANVRLSRHLNLNVDFDHFGSLDRFGPGDLRDDPSSNTLVNVTLIVKKFLKGYEGLELRGSVYNLFDDEWPIYVSEFVPYGWPDAGINFLVEVKYKF